MSRRNVAVLLCVLVLCGILVAGLVPFQHPRNAVTWLPNRNGLHFGKYGTIWSASPFAAPSAQQQSSCSLEMWLRPDVTNASGTILAFYAPANPLQLTVHQYHTLLILQRGERDDARHTQVIGIKDALHSEKAAFITVTSGPQKTLIYVDGRPIRTFPAFRMGDDCAGRLIFGTSPEVDNSWAGDLRGLAIYRRELTAAEVLQNFQAWTVRGRPEISGDENPLAVYMFDEHRGSVIHNAANGGINLNIPDRFSLMHEQFLKPFWREFKPTQNYLEDILVNIVGFIPLGVVFFAYWSAVRPMKHPVFATVTLGLAVSLTIEVLQSFLPTRDSGTTDLITNTLGTYLGVRLAATSAARALFAKFYRV